MRSGLEVIRDDLNLVLAKCNKASDKCLSKRLSTADTQLATILKCEEKKFDRVADLLYEIINEIDEWLQVWEKIRFF